MPQITLEEKKLQTLRRQLFGKQAPHLLDNKKIKSQPKEETSPKFTLRLDKITSTPQVSKAQSVVFDTNYLGKDLTKILILTSLALALQMLLYLGTKNNLIRLFN